MIIQQIIRHGEMVIVDEDTEDAGLVRFNVAQYVSYDFGNDGLSFSNPLYNRVLQEAVEHSEDHGFKAEIYFTQHPDLEMSKLAHRMAVDNYQLGRNFAKEMTPMKEVMNEMKTEKDMTRIRELMEEYQSTSELFRQIGKMLGR